MHFDHDNGIISALLRIDTTVQPIVGGLTNVLEVLGTGGIALPTGNTASRSTAAGMIRFNNELQATEAYDGVRWNALSDSASSTLVVKQANHGFSVLQLLTYNQSTFTYVSYDQQPSGRRVVVSRIIDSNTFVVTLVGLVPNYNINSARIWFRHPSTGTTSMVDPSVDSTAVLFSSATDSTAAIFPLGYVDGVHYGWFEPSYAGFRRSDTVVVYGNPIDTSQPVYFSDTALGNASSSNKTSLATHRILLSLSLYEMPSICLWLMVKLPGASTADGMSSLVGMYMMSLMATGTYTTGYAEGSPIYLSSAGGETPVPDGIPQVLGYVIGGSARYCIPYIEQNVSGAVYVSNTPPTVASGIPYMWVQTGLNTDGKGMTFWIEDGS